MKRRNWIALLGMAVIGFSALAISLRRAREAPAETRGACLDSMANFYWFVDRFVGLPFRRFTIRLAAIEVGDAVLDTGCANGTLTLLEKEKVGRSGYVAGIDIGTRMIAKARERADKRALVVDFRVASIDALPFPDHSFDVVTSSFMVHHLPTHVKLAGFEEVHRVLKHGGRYLVVDFPAARGLAGLITRPIIRLLASISDEAGFSLDLVEGRVPQMLRDAGFANVEEIGRFRIGGVLPVSFIVAMKSNAKPR